MIWKKSSIATKLFFAFLLTSICIILVIMALLTYQMRSGFSDYLLRVELQGFAQLADAVAESRQNPTNWAQLKSNPKSWHDLVRRSIGQGITPRARPTPPPRRSEGTRPPKRPRPDGLRPPPPGQGGRPDPLRLGQRLALLSPDGEHIAGARLKEGSYVASPIYADQAEEGGDVIAILALASPLDGRSLRDEQFLYEQFRSMLLVCLLAVILSALAAFLLARGVVRPIQSLVQGAKALTAGNYSARLPGEGPDEIGALVADFNILAASLEAAEKAERQWLSDASHELKTPLAILKGRIEGLQDGIYQADAKMLAEMHDTIERLNRLVSDINLLSHAREGKLLCSFREEDLSELVEDAIEHITDRYQQKGLRIETALSGPLILQGDRMRLRQMLDNLLENARRYTDAPGKVRISGSQTSQPKSTLRLIIEDSAPCPRQEEMDHLFERFYRTDPSRTRQSGGSGLGLAICRAIVKAHGGSIEAQPSSLGGLAVVIALPIQNVDVCESNNKKEYEHD